MWEGALDIELDGEARQYVVGGAQILDQKIQNSNKTWKGPPQLS